MSLIAVILHICVDILCGLLVLRLLKDTEWQLFTIVKALAIGMMVDTLFVGSFSFFGLSILASFILFSIINIGLFGVFYKKLNLSWSDKLLKGRVSIWEGLLLVFILEKLVWSIYSLIKLPVYFDDALNHWSGRGKALLYSVNWSWDPASPLFMGKAFGHEQYPLFASIWRATNTSIAGSPDGFIERVDGLLMWVIIVISIATWINEVSGKRWLGIVGASILSCLPLEAWHITAGYVEIYMQAYLILALWGIFNGKYVFAGLMTAALIWSKNEGLILFVPTLTLCLFFTLLLNRDLDLAKKAKLFANYKLTWIAIISPWILFKLFKGIGFTIPGNSDIGYVDGTLKLFGYAMFDNPSSSFFWAFILIGIIISSSRIIKDKKLLPIAAGAFTLLAMMLFVFTSTGAHVFLENQMTIHRSLLQIAPVFIVLVCLSLVGEKTKLKEVQKEIL